MIAERNEAFFFCRNIKRELLSEEYVLHFDKKTLRDIFERLPFGNSDLHAHECRYTNQVSTRQLCEDGEENEIGFATKYSHEYFRTKFLSTHVGHTCSTHVTTILITCDTYELGSTCTPY